MADTAIPAAQPTTGPVAQPSAPSPLVLLALQTLLNPNATAAQKAMAAAKLGLGGIQGAAWASPAVTNALSSTGSLSGLGSALSYAGPVLQAAGLGYGLYNLAGSDASTGRKFVEGAKTYAAATNPYAAANRLLHGVGGHFTRSSSPQVRGAGRFIQSTAEPAGITAFEDVISGDFSPSQAAERQGGWGKMILKMASPFGGALHSAIFGRPEPTTGEKFRRGLDYAIKRVGLGNLRVDDPRSYNMTPEQLNTMTPEQRSTATAMGHFLGSLTPDYARNPNAYGIQASNVLLTQAADKLTPAQALAVFQQAGLTTPEAVLAQIVRSAGDRALETDLEPVWASINNVFGRTDFAPLQQTLMGAPETKALRDVLGKGQNRLPADQQRKVNEKYGSTEALLRHLMTKKS